MLNKMNNHYIITVGNTSRKIKEMTYIILSEDVVTEALKNVVGKTYLENFKPKVKYEYDLTDLDEKILEKKYFNIKRIDYISYKIFFNQKLLSFSNEELGEEREETYLQGEAGETVFF